MCTWHRVMDSVPPFFDSRSTSYGSRQESKPVVAMVEHEQYGQITTTWTRAVYTDDPRGAWRTSVMDVALNVIAWADVQLPKGED